MFGCWPVNENINWCEQADFSYSEKQKYAIAEAFIFKAHHILIRSRSRLDNLARSSRWSWRRTLDVWNDAHNGGRPSNFRSRFSPSTRTRSRTQSFWLEVRPVARSSLFPTTERRQEERLKLASWPHSRPTRLARCERSLGRVRELLHSEEHLVNLSEFWMWRLD